MNNRYDDVQAQALGDMIALVDAMWQLLDDMGVDGKCVCGAAKAQARVAIEPFLGELELDWPLDQAKAILDEVWRCLSGSRLRPRRETKSSRCGQKNVPSR